MRWSTARRLWFRSRRRRDGRRLLLCAGRSNPGLAERIAAELDIGLGRAELETFANGEVYCRYPDSIRGADLHAGQIQGFFTIPVDHMTALLLFADHFRAQDLRGSGVVCVSPDLGRVKLARRLSRMLDAELAVVNKTRPRHEVAAATQVIGDVRDKVALIGDDMIVTGGTIVAAAEALRAAGAREVRAFATHPLFTAGALEMLAASGLVEIAVTDTVVVDAPERVEKLTILSVAGLLARTIENVFADASVSGVFAGENELF